MFSSTEGRSDWGSMSTRDCSVSAREPLLGNNVYCKQLRFVRDVTPARAIVA